MWQACIKFLIVIFLPSLCMAASSFEAGKQYEVLAPSIRAEPNVQRLMDVDPGKAQVLFFFSYLCYWCGQLDKDFDAWGEKQGKNVVIYHYPVVFNQPYEIMARTYYTIESLPNPRQLDNDVFEALHNKKINLTHQDTLYDFFEHKGIPKARFAGIYNSFGVEMKIKRAKEIGSAYKIVTTPHIIVNTPSASYGTSWAMAGSKGQLFAILEYLINKQGTSTP